MKNGKIAPPGYVLPIGPAGRAAGISARSSAHSSLLLSLRARRPSGSRFDFTTPSKWESRSSGLLVHLSINPLLR